MSKPIEVNVFSQKSIKQAIKELKEYKKWVLDKTEQLLEEFAKAGFEIVDENMQKASYTFDEKGIQSGSDTTHTTKVKMKRKGNVITADLIVEGKELMFIEFGAGVYYNGSAGSSPHPKGAVNGMIIGSYGKHHGIQKVWGYYNDSGSLILTHGVQAQMPVYKAEIEIIQNYINIARRVFNDKR